MAGRPLKFKNPEEFEAKAKDYFDNTPLDEWTITGLALALDTTRETLMDYEERDEFSDAVKRAKLRVEMSYEKSLRKRGGAGDIFGLKNFGWKDKQEIDHGGADKPVRVLLDAYGVKNEGSDAREANPTIQSPPEGEA